MISQTETKNGLTAALWAPPPARKTRWQVLGHPVTKTLLFLLGDLSALLVGYAIAGRAVHHWLRIPWEFASPSGYLLFFPFFLALVLYAMNGYGNADLRRPEKELELSVKALSLAFLALLAANFLVFKGAVFSRYLILGWYVSSVPLLVCARFTVRGAYEALWARGEGRQRSLLIAGPERLSRYQELLAVQRHHAYELLGVIPLDQHADYGDANLPILGSLDQWEEVAVRHQAKVLVIDLPSSANSRDSLLQILDRCREMHLDVEVFTDLLNGSFTDFEFDEFSGCLRISPKPQWSRQAQWFCKCVLDRGLGLIGSIFTILLIPPIWILLKLEDGGPLFHRREYVGCDGATHYYLKFRTMVVGADEVLRSDPQLKEQFAKNHKLKNDPRILRFGHFMRKYSIDECPQFFSLLAGKLTLVGPRVISREEMERYGEFVHKRMKFTPGITGYWQVTGRQKTSYDERVRMDMFYLDHWSLWLDLVIIAKTTWKVVRADGAY